MLLYCRPAYAVPRILAKTGLTLTDIDVIEIHEAFAVSNSIAYYAYYSHTMVNRDQFQTTDDVGIRCSCIPASTVIYSFLRSL